MPNTIIQLHLAAPLKPHEGWPCNGCGVCCALETCPLARIRYLQQQGPCPALTWSAQESRYHCGLLLYPEKHLRYLPLPTPMLKKLIRRWIAAGEGCDCHAEIIQADSESRNTH